MHKINNSSCILKIIACLIKVKSTITENGDISRSSPFFLKASVCNALNSEKYPIDVATRDCEAHGMVSRFFKKASRANAFWLAFNRDSRCVCDFNATI